MTISPYRKRPQRPRLRGLRRSFISALLVLPLGASACVEDPSWEPIDELDSPAEAFSLLDAGAIRYALEGARHCADADAGDLEHAEMQRFKSGVYAKEDGCLPKGAPINIEPKAPSSPEECSKPRRGLSLKSWCPPSFD